jgi:mannan endo-1,4-beta-mannosidase
MATATDFVTVKGADFMLGGKPYRFAGTNCYYLSYKDRFMVDDVLESAAKQGFEVIRTWAFIDIGNKNGTDSVDKNYPIKDGHYFQYWDGTKPAYNDTNMEGLDYAIAKASSLGLRLLLTLTNNWHDFGGMDQYVMWRSMMGDGKKGAGFHDDFYSDPTIKSWYKDYAKHLITRKNTISGLVYGQDPTIFAWELANEPRCKGTGTFPQSKQCVLDYAVYGKDPVANKTTAWAQVSGLQV